VNKINGRTKREQTKLEKNKEQSKNTSRSCDNACLNFATIQIYSIFCQAMMPDMLFEMLNLERKYHA